MASLGNLSVHFNRLFNIKSITYSLNNYDRLQSIQLQLVRGARRSCRPRPWWPKKKANTFWETKDLTTENKAFLNATSEEAMLQKLAEKSASVESPLKEGPWKRNEWATWSRRTGVLAVKIGVMPQWLKNGKTFKVTLLQVIDNHVVNYIPPEEFTKYNTYREKWPKVWGAVVVGALSSHPSLYTKAYNNLFSKAGVPPKRKLARFTVTPDAAIEPGTQLNATHFRVGDYVDCMAKTIGHGFQGVVKRWGFKGGPATHGNTKWHRRPGSIGSGRECARVRKGKKMPGHMGMEWRRQRGLQIMRINTKYNVLYVKSNGIPGPNHCYVRVNDTSLIKYRTKQMLANPPLMPTYYKEDLPQPLPEEIFHPDLFQFAEPSITFVDVAPVVVKKAVVTAKTVAKKAASKSTARK